ncbi:MAG: DUF4902 domain-containing protein [Burkholderiales bacterium]|nr:DUF4902 domain-containing protein [Burkholderiales bacterium]
MTIPAWQLISWKPVLTTLPEFRRALIQMRPLGDAAADGPPSEPRLGPRQGQALWAMTLQGLPLGLAWDWAEVRDDVVALCDPMNVLSNVRLVDDEGAPLGDAERMLHLNSAIHDLDWQAHVVHRHSGWAQPMAA